MSVYWLSSCHAHAESLLTKYMHAVLQVGSASPVPLPDCMALVFTWRGSTTTRLCQIRALCRSTSMPQKLHSMLRPCELFAIHLQQNPHHTPCVRAAAAQAILQSSITYLTSRNTKLAVICICRFRNHPLVASPPHFRFYCGTPLVSSTGLRLGTLYVCPYVALRLWVLFRTCPLPSLLTSV